MAWIEPIPDVFEQLSENLKPFPKQSAYRYLLAAEDGREFTFHITDNGAESLPRFFRLPSIGTWWPEVGYAKEIKICGTTLGTFIEKEQIRLADYQALVLDTQGSELMILKGAANLLPNFRFIQVEVADFESYAGCCKLPEITTT